ncbi:MAG: hypothetical protein RLZ55_1210, partial [Actinomycetota bacterium]
PNPLDPPRISRTDDGLAMSHLTFNRRHPERFHVPLRMALQGAAQQGGLSAGAAHRVAAQTAEAIAAANLELLDAVVAAGRGSADPAPTPGRGPAEQPPRVQPALDLLAEAAAAQAAIIRTVAAAG